LLREVIFLGKVLMWGVFWSIKMIKTDTSGDFDLGERVAELFRTPRKPLVRINLCSPNKKELSLGEKVSSWVMNHRYETVGMGMFLLCVPVSYYLLTNLPQEVERLPIPAVYQTRPTETLPAQQVEVLPSRDYTYCQHLLEKAPNLAAQEFVKDYVIGPHSQKPCYLVLDGGKR
jgi:hypothetical protein